MWLIPPYWGLIGVALLRDTARATAKSVAGIGTPSNSKRTTRALRVFLCGPVVPAISVMAGWAGQPHGWPVSLGPGSSNPVQLVTSQRLEPLW
ncbi:TPA: ash family protein [Aeromonas hydrophila]|nr:ash family protein [Aeromonas hydrophila]